MKANQTIVLAFILFCSFNALAQIRADSLPPQKNIWNKKFYWGVTFNTSWATIKGSQLPNKYFWKPSVGGSFRTEYYFTKNIGIGIGLQYQQKGSGIITPDKDKSYGNPDSTYRARIKLHAFEVPIEVIFRSNEIIRNTRFQGSFGVSPMSNFKSTYVLYSVEDGFHDIENHRKRYYKSDVALTASMGININAGNSSIFQVHFYGTWGTKNVYNTSYYPDAHGKTKVIGLKLGWLF